MEEIKKDTLIENLNVSEKTKEILLNAGYTTIGDLTLVRMEEVEQHFSKVKPENLFDYDGLTAFGYLKAIMHRDYKANFVGEYEGLGLSNEAANVPTTQLDLPVQVKNVLTRQFNAFTFGDILNIDYAKLLKARNFGEHYLRALKDYVHGLGYALKDEEPSLNETLDALREKGVKLLEETIDNAKLYMPMYRNGIYTIEDLLNFGPDVYKLVGFGALRQRLLVEKMQELNLRFNVTSIDASQRPAGTIDIPRPEVAIRPTDAIVEQAKRENEAIKIRIEQKEGLVAEYDRLMAERQQLIAREQELDKLIESKVSVMKEGKSHGRK